MAAVSMGPDSGRFHSKFLRPLHDDSIPYWFGAERPAPAPLVTVEQSGLWLGKGWRDMMAAPHVSLTYGAVFVVTAYLIVFGLVQIDMGSLVLPMAAGFMLVGPLAAVGLYEVSRRLEAGESVTLADTVAVFHRHAQPLLLAGLVLMLAFLTWIMLALVIFAGFYNMAPPNLETFFSDVLTAPQAPLFLLVGTVVGGVIAAAVFALAAVTLPMLIDRPQTTPVQAMAVSVRTVAANWKVMSGWAATIVLIAGMGMVTFFIGLAFALPLLGHASWHCYKGLVGDA